MWYFGIFPCLQIPTSKEIGITRDITILTVHVALFFFAMKNISNKSWMFLREIYFDIDYVVAKIKLFSLNKKYIYFLIQ